MKNDNFRMGAAYQRVDLFDEQDRPVMAAQKGNKELRDLVESVSGDAEGSVEIQRQALYEEEVDHNIEEVGIMAIREVRYVTEREWQKMIEMQKNQQEIMKYLQQISRFEKRHTIASNIPRNDKGQFVAKNTKKQKPIKPAGRKGRPRKNERE